MKLVAAVNRCIKCGNISEGHLCKNCRTITVIDLLNKIVNGEELPKQIIYNGIVWRYNGFDDYVSTHNFENLLNDTINNSWIITHLNTEIEIVDELEETEDLSTISEEQALFNKLKRKDQEYILNFMRMLQPCEDKRNGDKND